MRGPSKWLHLDQLRFFRKRAGGNWYKVRPGNNKNGKSDGAGVWTQSPDWIFRYPDHSAVIATENYPVAYETLLKGIQGTNVYCPICEGHFLTFLPFGRVKRANAQCPGCDSLERHRLQFLYFKNETGFLNGAMIRVLHVAPEQPLYKRFKNIPQIEYVPVDMFTPGYAYPADVRNMSILDMDFPDNSFDLVICNHVLEHIEEDSKAMRQLYRVLKPGGMAFLQVPIDNSLPKTQEDFTITDPVLREKHYGQPDHVRQYGLDYKDRLQGAGFKVDVRDYITELGENAAFKYGLMKGEDLYVCSK